MGEDLVAAAALLQSLSSFLGPPASRGSKFVGERRQGEADTFELTTSALKLVEYATPPGLISTVLGSSARHLGEESFGCGVAWTLVFTLSLYLKLKRHVLNDSGATKQFSLRELKECVKSVGVECLALTKGTCL